MNGGRLVEEAQAVAMVVAMDLEVGVVDMVAEGFKIKQKQTATVLGNRESKVLSGKLQVTVRQSSQMH